MALEIERKWLVDGAALPFGLEAASGIQGEPGVADPTATTDPTTVADSAAAANSTTVAVLPPLHIRQSYVSFRPQVRLRDINHGACYLLTVKADVLEDESGLVKREFEAEITAASYHELSAQTVGKTLVKTRHRVPDGEGHIFEIDVYEDEFAGLVVAEMEFADAAEAAAYPTPAWATADISTDPYYKNVVMAQR